MTHLGGGVSLAFQIKLQNPFWSEKLSVLANNMVIFVILISHRQDLLPFGYMAHGWMLYLWCLCSKLSSYNSTALDNCILCNSVSLPTTPQIIIAGLWTICIWFDCLAGIDDDRGKRQTHVENKGELFAPPSLTLTQYLEHRDGKHWYELLELRVRPWWMYMTDFSAYLFVQAISLW